ERGRRLEKGSTATSGDRCRRVNFADPQPPADYCAPQRDNHAPDLTAPMLPTIWAEKRCRDGNSWPQADGTRAIRIRNCSSIERLACDPRYPTVSGRRRFLRSAIAPLRLRVCKPAAYAVRRLLGRW